jgi:hypothetical protein
MRLAFDVRDSWRFVLLGRDVAIEHANAKRRGASAERRAPGEIGAYRMPRERGVRCAMVLRSDGLGNLGIVVAR